MIYLFLLLLLLLYIFFNVRTNLKATISITTLSVVLHGSTCEYQTKVWRKQISWKHRASLSFHVCQNVLLNVLISSKHNVNFVLTAMLISNRYILSSHTCNVRPFLLLAKRCLLRFSDEQLQFVHEWSIGYVKFALLNQQTNKKSTVPNFMPCNPHHPHSEKVLNLH